MSILSDKLAETGDGIICPVAVLIKDKKILIGLRNYTADKYKDISVWTIPGGRTDVGETVEATLRREVAEEVGITDLLIHDYLGQLPGAKEGDIIYLFSCGTGQEPQLMEPEKFSEWRWSAFADIPENYINPAALELIRKFI